MMTALSPLPARTPATPAERRGETRQRTCFAVGKLIVDGAERVCIVRNLSDQGVGIELDAPPPAGARVRIEARSVEPADATVIWSRDRLAGLRLDAPVVSPPSDQRPRSPRFACARAARLIVEDQLIDAPLRDIALGGARVGSALPARDGTLVVLLVATLSLSGRICWQAGGASGIRFTRPLSVAELAALLAEMHTEAGNAR